MFQRSIRAAAVMTLAFAFLAGCASSQMKARKDQRDKASQSSKMYCDFVNGEIFPDVEVQLNLEMAKRCDNEKSFTVTSYRTTNENMGVIYCCALHDSEGGVKPVEKKSSEKPAEKATENKKAEPKDASKKPASSGDELGD